MKKRLMQLVLGAAAVLAGCGGGPQDPLWKDIDRLNEENTTLSLETQALRQENERLNEQVRTLSGLEPQTRLEALDTLAAVRISKRTGLYDMNEDGTDETLVVYLEPLDTARDTVKAVGKVRVELWNLDAPPADAKLTEWTLEPETLRELWGGNIFASYYRLPFELTDVEIDAAQELTVKVTFTDFLSGKVLRDQATVTP